MGPLGATRTLTPEILRAQSACRFHNHSVKDTMIKRLLAAMLAMLAAAAFAAVDVNKASASDLETVKGIGPAISSHIIEARKKGPFKDWQDMIERVKGVGEANAAKFSAEGLTVNGATFKGAAPATRTDAPKAAAPATKPTAAAPAPVATPAPAATKAATTAPAAADAGKAAKSAKSDKPAAAAAKASEPAKK